MKRLMTICFFASMVLSIWSIPASKKGVVVQQSDGTSLVVYPHGDEYFHWIENEQGEWLKKDSNGMYNIVEPLSSEAIAQLRISSPKRVVQEQHKSYPLNIAPRGLVILVSFADKAFATDKAEMDSMMLGANYTRSYQYRYLNQVYKISSQGSARQYFYDSSFGQYNPQFDVVGPVTISNNMEYYGQNDNRGNDKYASTMVKEACLVADTAYNIDFSQYDNDKDGKVDFVYIIYAGYGEADSYIENTIWPHAYKLSYDRINVSIDGKKIDSYACGNEINYTSKLHDGIGTFCHEFSHVLGLPDIYPTNGDTHRTHASWDIMDYGPYNNDSNTPPSYSAYERFFVGWLTPTQLTDTGTYTLSSLLSSNQAYLVAESTHNLIGNDPSPATFYLLENRQLTGWDSYLYGHGMMLTRIQYNYSSWYNNTPNDDAKRLGIDLIEADGIVPKYSAYSSDYYGKPGDLFPTGATKYTFSETMLNDIKEINGQIQFCYTSAHLTDITPTPSSQSIIAIYDMLGNKQNTIQVSDLGKGVYIIQSDSGNKKIVIP